MRKCAPDCREAEQEQRLQGLPVQVPEGIRLLAPEVNRRKASEVVQSEMVQLKVVESEMIQSEVVPGRAQTWKGREEAAMPDRSRPRAQR
jgi:hypothetical protein